MRFTLKVMSATDTHTLTHPHTQTPAHYHPSIDTFLLTTPRARLRCWSAADLPLARLLWGNADVMRLMSVRGPMTEDEIQQRLNREIMNQQTRGYQYWPAFTLDTGAFLGCCGFKPLNSPSFPGHRTAEETTGTPGVPPGTGSAGAPPGLLLEFGVHLLPAYWNKGYATELGRAAIDHAFRGRGRGRALPIHTLFAGHHPLNHASSRMLEKLGFRPSHAEHFPTTGLMHPWLRLDRE